MALEEHARERGLSDQTIRVLAEEEYSSIEAVMTIRDEDMDFMKIKRGQQGLLRNWIEELKASVPNQFNATDPSRAGTIERSTAAKQQSKMGDTNLELDEASEGTIERITAAKQESKIDDTNLELDEASSAGTIERDTAAKQESKMDDTNLELDEASSEGSSELPNVDDLTLGLDDKATKDVTSYIRNHGVQNLGKFMEKNLSSYKDMKINIAVTGQSGAGKSLFINSIRNLTGRSIGAAQVGVKETTLKVQPYPDPTNRNLIYWDLPGVGTPNFPREGYLKKVRLDSYDFFLILTSARFQENDLYLAQQIHNRGKQFFLLRTKVDMDIADDHNDHSDIHSPDNVIAQVRADCEHNLKLADLPVTHIYVVSSRLNLRTRYDFPRLMDTIVSEAKGAKKTSLILSLKACSEKGIEAKKEQLAARIKWVAIRAALGESPEEYLKAEVQLYGEQFGLIRSELQNLGVDQQSLGESAVTVLAAFVEDTLTKVFPTLYIFTKPWHMMKMVFKTNEISDRLTKTLDMCAAAAIEIIEQAQKQ